MSEKLEMFRAMLIQKINELLSEAGKTVSEMTSGKENFPDPNDRASCNQTATLNYASVTGNANSLSKCRKPLKELTTEHTASAKLAAGRFPKND